MFRIGIDVGGTFTDFVVARDGELPRYSKLASTPHDPSDAVMAGLGRVAATYGLPLAALLADTEVIVHGTTVATNALVQRRGARVALVTTDGFRDLLEMREGLKEDRYNLRMDPMAPLVPRYLRLTVPERVRADGSVAIPLDDAALDPLLDSLEQVQVDAVAVCFLFSYLRPEHEERVAARLRQRFPRRFVSTSHEVLPQVKEFDRLSTTTVNAYVGPVYAVYLERLLARLKDAGLVGEVLVMQSNGGVAPAAASVPLAVRAILSGPAGGVSGAGWYGDARGERRLVAFDMGGTSTDISLVEDGRAHVSTERFEGGWKIAVPMIDVQTLGAGGGSIASVDAGGVLHVGPESAGADPGPACYGLGGSAPTVTDANLALGFLDPDNFLGGAARLDPALGREAIADRLARPLGLSVEAAAAAVHEVVSSSIAEGIRLQSVKRGVDPRDFALLAFGGAAGLQASLVARQLGVDRILLPAAAPVLSAFGMLTSDIRHDFSRSYTASLSSIDLPGLRSLAAAMASDGRAALAAAGIGPAHAHFEYSADMRYLDQIYEVNVPLPDLDTDDRAFIEQWADRFHARYEELYSYRQADQEIRLVTLRLSAIGRLPRLDVASSGDGASPASTLQVRRSAFLDGAWHDLPVLAFEAIPPGGVLGPAIVESPFTTVLLRPGDHVQPDGSGGLAIRIPVHAHAQAGDIAKNARQAGTGDAGHAPLSQASGRKESKSPLPLGEGEGEGRGGAGSPEPPSAAHPGPVKRPSIHTSAAPASSVTEPPSGAHPEPVEGPAPDEPPSGSPATPGELPAGTGVDPITLAVVGNRLQSIALEMMEVMLRTSMSQILNSSRDFSTAILDAHCQLVAQGEGIPVHISALPIAGAAVRDSFADIADGDLFALNDPYAGGSHLPDITVIRPVFHHGVLRFFAVNRAHHSDVGGATHGGYNPSASEIYHEGLRIPPLRIHEKGRPRNDLLRMLAANVRHPENFLGDLNAQVGSVDVAARRIGELLAAYGADRLSAIVAALLDATERQVRDFIRGWPDGVYYGESLVDDDGFESKLVPIRAKVTIARDSMTVDLSDSSPQVTGFINSAYANTRSLTHAAIMYLAPADVARNEGSARPVTVIAPKGLVVNANPPAPVCMSTNHCAEEIVEAIFKALAPALPQAVNAGFSRRLRYAITGVDPRNGRKFIWHFFFARGGGGASFGHDGWPNVGEVNVAGGIRSPSVEVTEERFPFFVRRHELRPGSGGAGEWRGGLGGVCEMVYEGQGSARLNTAGDGVVVPPFGLFGGQPGLPHRYSIVSPDGSERVLGSKETGVVVNPGDTIVALASGGGGYGDPASRDPAARARDLRDGLV